MKNKSGQTGLIDSFGRTIDYIRISITDRCDFRCVYCMTEDMSFLPRAKILTLEEIALLCEIFVDLGIKKIRLTGGEPLVRKNVIELMNNIGKLAGLKELTITTNGSQLEKYSEKIKKAGVSRINISLDTLDEKKFKELTRTGDLRSVLRGIEAARQTNFKRIKINSVILKNRNSDEVLKLAQFAIRNDFDISFIEEMPLGAIVEHDRAEAFYSSDQIIKDLKKTLTLEKSDVKTNGPSRYLRVKGTKTKIGFISPHSNKFCSECNRIRLTAEGQLLLCLGQENSIDLKELLRRKPTDKSIIKDAVISSIKNKPKEHFFELKEQPVILRFMSHTGG